MVSMSKHKSDLGTSLFRCHLFQLLARVSYDLGTGMLYGQQVFLGKKEKFSLLRQHEREGVHGSL